MLGALLSRETQRKTEACFCKVSLTHTHLLENMLWSPVTVGLEGKLSLLFFGEDFANGFLELFRGFSCLGIPSCGSQSVQYLPNGGRGFIAIAKIMLLPKKETRSTQAVPTIGTSWACLF